MSDCSNWRGDQIKATVEQEFRERRSEDSGARSVRGRQPERMLRVIAETTERVDVFRTRRVRTCLSLSVNESSRANPVRFLPSLRTLLHLHYYCVWKLLSYDCCHYGPKSLHSKIYFCL